MNRKADAIKNAEAIATNLYIPATNSNISTSAVYRRDTQGVESCPMSNALCVRHSCKVS
ncbi:hypothetical protein IE4872_PD00204 (plasmid) [Rhizobium gallicum]|uniref:Uncharacterized protein n=1 Tax=Rhizobium gallicum TaxID=56730 RepID=A0A1L5NS70_9HYPH|nr:hypothetical protein IE4872_PD00204 [Rhizobium gallicum]